MRTKRNEFYLIFNRKQWENYTPDNFKFTKEELDAAENSKDGFIGIRGSVRCYVYKNFQ